jgi:hypothetical protein
LFIAAFLLYSGLNLYKEYRSSEQSSDWGSNEQRKKAGRSALVSLFLCVLLLAKSMHNLYWLRFTAVQQAIGTPKGRPEGAAYLRKFAEDVKASGLVAELIARHKIQGLSVAAAA